MSFVHYSNASPFAAALPNNHVFSEVGSKRTRSESLDDDSTDSRPSKRSRSSNEDENIDSVSYTLFCPPAPKKAPRSSNIHDEDDDELDSPLRNLATEMAEAVLQEEPLPDLSFLRRIGEMSIAQRAAKESADTYCASVRVPDLGNRLHMRHPRVVLNLLRFIDSYNELAPDEERIHMPLISEENAREMLSHDDVLYPNEASAETAREFRYLIQEYSYAPYEDNCVSPWDDCSDDCSDDSSE